MRTSPIDAHQAYLIERAGAVVVRRLPPLLTPAGKVLPFHLVKLAHAAS